MDENNKYRKGNRGGRKDNEKEFSLESIWMFEGLVCAMDNSKVGVESNKSLG